MLIIPPYVECGAAIGVYEADNLLPAIEKILHNEETGKKLAHARKQFISEIGYNMDGQASRRVADIIRQMSEK